MAVLQMVGSYRSPVGISHYLQLHENAPPWHEVAKMPNSFDIGCDLYNDIAKGSSPKGAKE
jgi:hypothetical protein